MFSYVNPLPTLSTYLGPHKVGTSEYEIPISEVVSSSSVPNSAINTIKFRLYYPTKLDATSKEAVYWLPEPQKQWNEAYASFMGASSRLGSSMTSTALSMWNYTKLPVVKDAPLLAPTTDGGHPVCIFSHGLGGNFNTYSSIVGSLASYGIVCVAPEHRDGSAPISFIRNAEGELEESIPYQRHDHSPTKQVLNARNSQLRIRLWELELIYSVIHSMNQGKKFTNYALVKDSRKDDLNLENKLNLRPGRVTWAGHSFGAATVTQFVKSVYYKQFLPVTPKSEDQSKDKELDVWDWEPLYKCAADSKLVDQITADSPVTLLDLWTMPLRAETTKWLWERPMPCYDRQPKTDFNKTPSTVAIMSAEFYKWRDLLNRTRALLSQAPVEAAGKLARMTEDQTANPSGISEGTTSAKNPIAELSKQSSEKDSRSASPAKSNESSRTPSPERIHSPFEAQSAISSSTSLVPSTYESDGKLSQPASPEDAHQPHLYLIPQSAHLSQSDFGILYPNLTKYVMKAIEPQKTLELNLRAILAVMKGSGLPVDGVVEDDKILGGAKLDRWVRVPLVD